MVQKAKSTGPGALESAKRSGRYLAGLAGMVAIAFASGAGVSALAQQAVAPPTANLFQDQAGKLGARKCAALYASLGRGMTQGAAYTVKTETNKESPDTHMVQGVVGLTYNLPELKGQAGGIVLATPMPAGCEGYMVRVAPFQKSCAEIIRFLPAGSVEEQKLSGIPQYRLGGNQGQALVIPNGATCVVVTLTGMAQHQ